MLLVLLLALLGALISAAIGASLGLWEIVHGGVGNRLHEVNLLELALPVMHLHHYAALGALVGAGAGLALQRRRARLREAQALAENALTSAPVESSPPDRIGERQRVRAERYLRRRREQP